MNKVVARCMDGRVIKGLVVDFSPAKDSVHVIDPNDRNQVTEIPTSELKGVFFVKSLEGNPDHGPPYDFKWQNLAKVPGVKLKVTFLDGEVIYGTTSGYSPTRPGFFLVPANKKSNNTQVYIYTASTKSVETFAQAGTT